MNNITQLKIDQKIWQIKQIIYNIYVILLHVNYK
jgi:hypothetical protein